MYPIVEIEFYPMVTRYLIISITTVANLDQYFEKARIWTRLDPKSLHNV